MAHFNTKNADNTPRIQAIHVKRSVRWALWWPKGGEMRNVRTNFAWPNHIWRRDRRAGYGCILRTPSATPHHLYLSGYPLTGPRDLIHWIPMWIQECKHPRARNSALARKMEPLSAPHPLIGLRAPYSGKGSPKRGSERRHEDE